MIDNVKKLWDTNQITAGTPFMDKLSESIYEHFILKILVKNK